MSDSPPGPDEPLHRVCSSTALTRAERTAALRFVPHRITSEVSLDTMLEERSPRLAGGFRLVRGLAREVRSHLNLSEIGGELGRVDFVNDRCLYPGGGGWVLDAPDANFIGEPGEWEGEVKDDEGLGEDSALWLVDLVAGAVEASEQGPGKMLGAERVRYSAIADFASAATLSRRQLYPPLTFGRDLDPSRLPIDVWLDDAGRIRRAIFRRDRTVMTLELSEFGVPDLIELPPPEEVVPAQE